MYRRFFVYCIGRRFLVFREVGGVYSGRMRVFRELGVCIVRRFGTECSFGLDGDFGS